MRFKNVLVPRLAQMFCEFCHSYDIEEIFHLVSELERAKIPFEIEFHAGGFHIGYPSLNKEGDRAIVCSVILSPMSYGAEAGLLEISGLLTPEEEVLDAVVGYLPAADVYYRIAQHYGEYIRGKCHMCKYKELDSEEEPCNQCRYASEFVMEERADAE